MAVLRRLRETGLGRQVLLALVDQARQRGDQQVLLHAQRAAQGFYHRLGFVTQGEPFEEAGIAHIAMVLPL
jgi:predicted GNAT family N-acyltransferase